MSQVDDMMMQDAALAERLRIAAIAKRWDAYYGKMKKPLKVKNGDDDDNIILSMAGLIVTTGGGFLFGQEIDIDLSDKNDTADKWLDDFWTANRKQSTLLKLAINGGVCGHVFCKLIDKIPYPRIVVLDPATVSVLWAPDDFEHAVKFTITWNAIDPKTGKPAAYRQTITEDDGGQSWTITDEVNRKGTLLRLSNGWETIDAVAWNFPWPPIFHCQNLIAPNEFWGKSDIEDDVLEANNAVNFTATNTNRVLRFHAHPKTWGSGFTAKDLKIAPDDVTILPAVNAQLHNLEMTSDLSSSLAFYEKLKSLIHEISRVPEVTTGKLEGIGQLSGLALQILYGPIISKTSEKRLTYGEMITEVSRRALELRGVVKDAAIVINWPEALPVDTNGEAQTAVIYDQLGVSRDTILEKLGFDAEAEAKKKSEEQASVGDNLLKQFEQSQGGGAGAYGGQGGGNGNGQGGNA